MPEAIAKVEPLAQRPQGTWDTVLSLRRWHLLWTIDRIYRSEGFLKGVGHFLTKGSKKTPLSPRGFATLPNRSNPEAQDVLKGVLHMGQTCLFAEAE